MVGKVAVVAIVGIMGRDERCGGRVGVAVVGGGEGVNNEEMRYHYTDIH